MEDKPLYYKDLAKFFGKHERTIQILNNYMGDSWFCWSSEMKDIISLCSKDK